MSITFNADEILQMAERIERNGARFYHLAAENASGPARQALLDLAKMEEDHERTFAQMRSELSPAERRATVFDPTGEAGLYLHAMADGYVFDIRKDPAELLRGGEPLEEILATAIELEKDSIVFYVQMRELVPQRLGRERIEAIIKEELGHIAQLNKRLAEARGKGAGE